MNKILGMSFVVMLVSGFNLLSMDNSPEKQKQERREAEALLVRQGKGFSRGRLFGAVATIRKQTEAKKVKPETKEKKEDKSEQSPLKRLHDDLAAANQQDVVSVKKIKTNNDQQMLPIVVSPHQSPTKGLNRFNGTFVNKKSGVVCNLVEEKY